MRKGLLKSRLLRYKSNEIRMNGLWWIEPGAPFCSSQYEMNSPRDGLQGSSMTPWLNPLFFRSLPTSVSGTPTRLPCDSRLLRGAVLQLDNPTAAFPRFALHPAHSRQDLE